jgi:hypothetical protein
MKTTVALIPPVPLPKTKATGLYRSKHSNIVFAIKFHAWGDKDNAVQFASAHSGPSMTFLMGDDDSSTWEKVSGTLTYEDL